MKRAKRVSPFEYLRESFGYLILAVVLFFSAALIGYSFSSHFGFLDSVLRDLIEQTRDLEGVGLIWFIFQNNTFSSLFALFLGIFFGFFPVINSLVNGALVGYVLHLAIEATGSFQVAWRLLPHGIFELPAIFISIGLGMRLGFSFFENYFVFYKWNKLKIHRLLSVLLLMFSAFLAFVMAIGSITFSGRTDFTLLDVIFFFGGFLVSFVSFIGLLVLLFSPRALRTLQNSRLRYHLSSSFRVFITIVLPLLVVAAIIEGILITLF